MDAEILAKPGAFLAEIKSTARPSDVYADVGQLELYPRLTPRLAHHERLLLLSGEPSAAIAAAVGSAGVHLHGFSLTRIGKGYSVEFEAPFLKALGLD